MNLLIVSDNYKNGGLETYIKTIYEELKIKNNVYFAFSNFNSNLIVNKNNIFTDFIFNVDCTTNEFISDVNLLVKIIKNKKIDIILVNPFYCIFPCIFAAHITNTKIIFCYHGRSSINFTSTYIDNLLLDLAFENTFSKTFCVSKSGVDAMQIYKHSSSIWMPNMINIENYSEHITSNKKKWALISRLDDDKLSTIINFISIIDKLDINTLDIIGSGNRESEIKNYIIQNKIKTKIIFSGYKNNLDNYLKDYSGIIGIGRVVLEGLAMNYPTIVLGYDKIGGIIDKNIYERIKYDNFIPECIDNISIIELNNQIKDFTNSKFKLRNLVINDFSVQNNINRYINELKNTDFIQQVSISNLFNIFVKNSSEEKFYYSNNIYNIISEYIQKYFYNHTVNNKTFIFNQLISLNCNQYNNSKLIDQISKKNYELENINIELQNEIETLKEIINNITISSLLKNNKKKRGKQ